MATIKDRDLIAFRGRALRPHALYRTPEGGSLNVTAKRDLARYYNALADEARVTLADVTTDQWEFLAGATEHLHYGSRDYRAIRSDLQRYQEQHPSVRAQADLAELVEEVLKFTPWECLLLVDAVERYRLHPGDEPIAGTSLPVADTDGDD